MQHREAARLCDGVTVSRQARPVALSPVAENFRRATRMPRCPRTVTPPSRSCGGDVTVGGSLTGLFPQCFRRLAGRGGSTRRETLVGALDDRQPSSMLAGTGGRRSSLLGLRCCWRASPFRNAHVASVVTRRESSPREARFASGLSTTTFDSHVREAAESVGARRTVRPGDPRATHPRWMLALTHRCAWRHSRQPSRVQFDPAAVHSPDGVSMRSSLL